jgi:hypothetical protein
MFPHPTLNNAYEEFVKAGDTLENSEAWQAFEKAAAAGPTTLAAKRAVLYDPAIRSALDAIRVGLQKPAISPYAKLDDETLLPEVRNFRSIGRLLGMVEYVQLADGKVDAAVETLFEALRFGYAIQQGAAINGLVALAADTLALRQIEYHLDQFSVRDCGRLIQLVTNWMQKADPSRTIIANEERANLNVLKKYRNEPMKLFHALGLDDDNSDEAVRQKQFFDGLSENPEQAASVFDGASKLIASIYDYELANLDLPYWQRKPITPLSDSAGPAVQLANNLSSSELVERISERYARELAEVQMLGVCAAVMQYRWENDRLPAGLSALHQDSLTTDPFSGQSFTYKPLDAMRFEVTSVGPLDRATDPKPPAGQRVQMVMPPRRAN